MYYQQLIKRLGKNYHAVTTPPLTRRQFIKLTGFSGLAIGAAPLMAAEGEATSEQPQGLTPAQQPGEFLHIAPDGSVTIQINRLEFGQGSHTGLARVLADELDADWTMVNAVLAKAGEAYKDPLYGIQMTGGSTAIAHSFGQYRELGARARAMLIEAAAQKWGANASEITTDSGTIKGPSGQQASYGEMSDTAMGLPVPENVALKSPDQFRYIGKGVERLDTAAKSTGQQNFGMDMRRPGMKTVLLARPPQFGATVASFDDAAARANTGVVDVFKVDLDRGATGVAIAAEGYWPAKTARDDLKIDWNTPETIADTEAMTAEFGRLLSEPGVNARQADTAALAEATRTIKADFTFPFLAHTPMEPLNAVIEMQGEGESTTCEIWTGTQFQTIDQSTVAGVLGLKPEQVTINTMFAGGGFGRRATPTSDYLADTARVMKAWRAIGHGEPLKLVWSREDDVKGGYYRPFTMHRAEIGLNAEGAVSAWKHTIVSPSILKGTAFESFLVKEGVDATATEGVADSAYDLPISLDVHHPELPVPVLWWRSVGHTHSAFVMETLVDEIASKTNMDPVDLRRHLLNEHPRHLETLELAISKSGYGSRSLPVGQAWGVAIHESFGSVVAHVVEVSLADNRPQVHKVTSAIHCNTAVNPRSVIAQVEGAALMGIGTIIEGAEITLKDGVVQQSNFHDYILPRMPHMPDIDVHIVESTEPPTGVGEPGLPPIAPAIANAIYALTGKPIRSLPFRLS